MPLISNKTGCIERTVYRRVGKRDYIEDENRRR